jgi:hypothetical protein
MGNHRLVREYAPVSNAQRMRVVPDFIEVR